MANKPPHILVVDDDPTLSELYHTRLAAEGFTVDVAHDGQQGLAQAVADKPDIILLDMRMPNITGLEALEILKTTKSTKAIPVIVLSALNDDKLRAETLACGAAAYLVKAETMPAQIVEKIHSVLGS